MKNKEEIKQEKQRTLVFLDKATAIGDVKGIGKTDKNGFVVFGEGKENEANPNPFRKEGLKYESVPYDERITSIPSPYARMHITELAFYEYNCGNVLSKDYMRAMSHCLDIFELIYHSHELDLRERGITLQKIKLYKGTEEDDEIKKLNQKTKIYLQSLCAYREQYYEYIKRIKRKYDVYDYHFDFESLYVLKSGDGKVFGATSPFTGFFAKADCDLKDANNNPLLGPDNNGGNNNDGYRLDRNFLTGDPDDWCLLDKRGKDFIIFMYRLLKKTHLCYIFKDMFDAIKDRMKGDEEKGINGIDPDCEEKYAQDDKFKTDYPQFNIGGEPLQKIKNLKDVYIRPDGLDCSYLKYLLYLEKDAVDLTIKEYDDNIEKRAFDGKSMHWIGPNDILSDALVVLPYDINENYMSVPYWDSDDKMEKNRCLIPIKPFKIPNEQNLNHYEAFYRFWKDLIGNDVAHKLTIERQKKKLEDNKEDIYFVVKLKVMLDGAGEGYTVLRREYRFENSTTRNASDGVIVMSHNDKPMTLAFGLYPFVRNTDFDNIYKVLFYNKFNNDNYNRDYDLTFYQVDEKGSLAKLEDTKVVKNKTGKYDMESAIGMNSNYYSLKCDKNQLQFVELSLKKSVDKENKEKRELTSLIVPKMRNVDLEGRPVNVAVDLGTSNTYVAYSIDGVVHRISTHHMDKAGKEWTELMFLNSEYKNLDKMPKGEVKLEKRSLNLYSPDVSEGIDMLCLKSQLWEFIPSWISTRLDGIPEDSLKDEEKYMKAKKDYAYLFPIPTVINLLKQNCSFPKIDTKIVDDNDNLLSSPLVFSSIPFAYYDLGMRPDADNRFGGTEFKWFTKKEDGVYKPSPDFKAYMYLFMTELLFIIRSHLLSSGYRLDNLRLIWSYPLSFDKKLKEEYERAWVNAYKMMICNIKDNEVDDKIICTNESCTPIFALQDLPRNAVLVDIGGGSSDVVGYDENRNIRFVSSFGFAGNSLYCEGELNKDNKGNLYLNSDANCFLQKARQIIKDAKEIKLVESASDMMNYGFSEMREKFNGIFYDSFPSFLLLLHNTALIYHIAQLCKIKFDNKCPEEFHLTGNGSKLFGVTKVWNYEDIIKNTFKYVYGVDSIDFSIKPASNPKAATAEGALTGLVNNRDKIIDKRVSGKVIMLGDEETVFNYNDVGLGEVEVPDEKLDPTNYDYKIPVKTNVQKFFKMLYSDKFKIYHKDYVMQDQLEKYLDKAIASNRVVLHKDISQSLFFQCISIIIENLMLDYHDKKK